MRAPCKNCPERYVGCHAECEKYLEFYQSMRQLNAATQERKKADNALKDMTVKRANRIARHLRKDIKLDDWGR